MNEYNRGIVAVFLSYLLWGILPVYWKTLADVPPAIILAHRIVWSAVTTGVVLVITGGMGRLKVAITTNPRIILMLCASGVTVTMNWYIYIWAVNTGRVLDSSLGYFINPLVSVAFGVIFLHERLRKMQIAALSLAGVGVAIEAFSIGQVPVVAIFLALTFALYALLRKKIPVEALGGLFLETAIVSVPALIWLVWMQATGATHFPYPSVSTDMLLVGTGIITSIPLVLFAWGTRRIPLTLVGVLQYIAPTLMFLAGTVLYGEPVSGARMVTFGAIWTALAIYTADSFIFSQKQKNLIKP